MHFTPHMACAKRLLLSLQCLILFNASPAYFCRYGAGPPTNASCWVPTDAYTLASSDLQVWMYREKIALARFLETFGHPTEAAAMNASAAALKDAVLKILWDGESLRAFTAYNTSSKSIITAKTHLLAFPVFAGPSFVEVRDTHSLTPLFGSVAMVCPCDVM
jgi:hypothetical protein